MPSRTFSPWLLSLLIIVPLLGSCRDSTTTGPDSTYSLDPAAAPKFGFFITGGGYTNAKVDLDDGTAGFQGIYADYVAEAPSTIVISSGAAIGGADTTAITLTLKLLGFGKGTFGWDNLTEGDSFIGAIIVVAKGKAAGVYRSTEGSTVVTEYTNENGKLHLVGKFGGTLKDTTGRSISVSGGRFVVEK